MYRTLETGGYDPFGLVRNLQREMNRVFNGYDGRGGGFPAVNIWSNHENVVVTAELPGMDPEAIDVSVAQGQLTISGERIISPPEGDMQSHRQERGQGSFARAFRLPFDVDSTKVSARYQDGVLSISLPRLEESKPKKITVNVK
ncbi:MAG: Hsp20/alpha crystallin family protein [Victivallales bacterium]|nr:Hsp20/alpha crystallin family protein [Victivallales bacterium]